MKKKVAFFAEILVKHYDGASRTMFHIIDRIPKDKFEFSFICGVAPEERFEHQVMKVCSTSIPFNSTYKVATPLLDIKKIWGHLDEFKPDIIHVASPSPLGNLALWYAKKHNIPTVGIYHTHFISYVDYYLEKIPLVLPAVKNQVVKGQRKFYDKFDKLYVPTTQMVKELGDYGFATEHMSLWQRGLDHTVFHPGQKDIDALKNITGNDKPTIIYASRLVWEKNLQTLAALYKLIQANGAKYNILVAGDGVAMAELQKLMPEAYFLGKVPQQELAMLYASCDAFVFPSVTETYGNVVVEAMASGCPCVIAAGGGSQSHVQDGRTGYLCPPNDADAYMQAIDHLIANPSHTAAMVQTGYKYTADLDWDKLCQRYFSEISDMADRHYTLKSA